MLASLLAVMVFVIARGRVADPDIWWHLHNAEQFLITHSVPRVDTYSFTVIGQPWINPEYLGEVPYYLSWRLFGLAGIEGLTLLLLEGIFLGLLYLCQRQSGSIKASIVACCVAVCLGSVSFGPRTILFGYAYLVLLLAILERFRSTSRAPLWLIPPLFCLWINTHGSWSLGLIVFVIVIGSGLIEGHWGRLDAVRWTPSQTRKLLVTIAASVAALFVNPYGYKLVVYPLDVAFKQRVSVAHIQEWMSVDFHTPRGKIVLLLVIAILAYSIIGRYRWKLQELGLVLFGLYCGLTYDRFLFLAAILTVPSLAKMLDFMPPYQPEIDKPLLNGMIMAGILGFMVGGLPSQAGLQKAIARSYPADVLPYLHSHRLSGPVLNEYTWGGYLGWNDRNFRAFIDSRADIFDHRGVFKDYVDALGAVKAEPVLEKYGIRYVLFPPDEPLTYLLEHDKSWKVIFKGDVSVLLERQDGALAAAANPEAKNAGPPGQ
jgi:hypothetical protein